jgi:hypothetical protein
VNATTADHNDKFVAIIDSNVIVNGMLIVDEFWFVATTDDTKSITVNGTIMDRHETVAASLTTGTLLTESATN